MHPRVRLTQQVTHMFLQCLYQYCFILYLISFTLSSYEVSWWLFSLPSTSSNHPWILKLSSLKNESSLFTHSLWQTWLFPLKATGTFWFTQLFSISWKHDKILIIVHWYSISYLQTIWNPYLLEIFPATIALESYFSFCILKLNAW